MPNICRRPFHELTAPEQAGILSNTAGFRVYADRMTLNTGTQTTKTAAAEFIRQHCGIKSRRDLATNRTAAAKFQTLRTEYDAWRGAIPPQR